MNLQIQLTNVNKHYGAYHALRDINLDIPQGTFVALVGPSGCGKSTLLRSLAGLETITGGTLKIKGETVNQVPPRLRDIAMVFQSYALYPHMSVLKNLTYSLRLKGVSKVEAQKRAEEVAATVGLTALLHRYPRELSGGQRQRVAMGRAIIRNPKAFLFDEPLSNLDAALRVRMRKEVRALHDRLGATSVYVTHDQVEAMTMADIVVVMRDGVIEQQGSPLDLYDRPCNRFVAGFIGSPAMNFIEATVNDDGLSVRLDLPSNPALSINSALEPGRRVVIGVRPEHWTICPPGEGQVRLPVGSIEVPGSTTLLTSATTPEISVIVNGRLAATGGDILDLSVEPQKLHVFDAETERSLL
ncbi:ABC transporter ATP-binding protein [Shinella sp.]|uniref:ABC transporter ATP-binding protein n=1 Tax=Shinella sp. TaxID=1870904 RepID=UPI003F6F6930